MQSYTNTTRTHLPKDAQKACFAAGSYYSCLAKAGAEGAKRFSLISQAKGQSLCFTKNNREGVFCTQRIPATLVFVKSNNFDGVIFV